MTVAELIAKLQEFDPALPVRLHHDNNNDMYFAYEPEDVLRVSDTERLDWGYKRVKGPYVLID